MIIKKLNPHNSIGYLAYKMHRCIFSYLNRRFQEEGEDITVEQWQVMIPLSVKPGISQADLAECTSREKTGLSRLLDSLESRGYIERKTDEVDRRVKRLYVTDRGQEVLERTVDLAVEVRDFAVADIDPEEMATCMRVLRAMITKVADHVGVPGLPPEDMNCDCIHCGAKGCSAMKK